MTYKQIIIDETLHNQVKAAAALAGQSIRVYTENALRQQLPPDVVNKEPPRERDTPQ